MHTCLALYIWNHVFLRGFQWFPSVTDDFPQSHRRSGWNLSLRCEPVWSSIREAVCVYVCGERGWREECLSAWQRDERDLRREIVPVLEVILRGRNAWMCVYWRFYDCLLWLCLSGPFSDHISGAKRLFCAGMRKLRLDIEVCIPTWIVYPLWCLERADIKVFTGKTNACMMHVTPEMLNRGLLGKCCFAYIQLCWCALAELWTAVVAYAALLTSVCVLL